MDVRWMYDGLVEWLLGVWGSGCLGQAGSTPQILQQ